MLRTVATQELRSRPVLAAAGGALLQSCHAASWRGEDTQRFRLFRSLIQVISSSNLESRSFENCLRHITRAFTARILLEKRVLLHLKYGQSFHCADIAFCMQPPGLWVPIDPEPGGPLRVGHRSSALLLPLGGNHAIRTEEDRAGPRRVEDDDEGALLVLAAAALDSQGGAHGVIAFSRIFWASGVSSILPASFGLPFATKPWTASWSFPPIAWPTCISVGTNGARMSIAFTLPPRMSL